MDELEFPGFNSETVEPAKDTYSPAPAGKGYKLMVTDAVYKATKKGNGTGINLTFEIVEGQYIGKKIFAWLNLENPNAEAQQIGQGELSALCRAINIKDLRSPSQLKDIPFYGTLGVEQDNQGGDKNFVRFGSLKSTRDGKVDRDTKVNKNITDKFEAPSGEPAPVDFTDDTIPF